MLLGFCLQGEISLSDNGSADIMEETLLNIGKMTFQVFEEDKIIQAIDIANSCTYVINIEHIDSNRITFFREIVIYCCVTH